MAFSASNATSPADRAWSLGPVKVQILTCSAANGDTSGTATADGLSTIYYAALTGFTQTAAPTFSGNVVTVAFADPTATRYGQMIVIGV